MPDEPTHRRRAACRGRVTLTHVVEAVSAPSCGDVCMQCTCGHVGTVACTKHAWRSIDRGGAIRATQTRPPAAAETGLLLVQAQYCLLQPNLREAIGAPVLEGASPQAPPDNGRPFGSDKKGPAAHNHSTTRLFARGTYDPTFSVVLSVDSFRAFTAQPQASCVQLRLTQRVAAGVSGRACNCGVRSAPAPREKAVSARHLPGRRPHSVLPEGAGAACGHS